MNYKEYEMKANTTKAYDQQVAIPYVVLGLCGELGETYEKINQTDEPNFNIEDLKKEIGDQLWYLAMIRVELNLSIEEGWNWNEVVDESSPFELPSEVGKIAEQVKKWLRDDWKSGQENAFPEKRKPAVIEAWKNIWKHLNRIALSIDTTIEQIAIQNNEKLASRKERNQIHGSGDNR